MSLVGTFSIALVVMFMELPECVDGVMVDVGHISQWNPLPVYIVSLVKAAKADTSWTNSVGAQMNAPLGTNGVNCDMYCPYRCRSCDRTTGKCLLWCSDLCLDGVCELRTGCCRLNMTKLLEGGCGAYNRSGDHCEDHSRYCNIVE